MGANKTPSGGGTRHALVTGFPMNPQDQPWFDALLFEDPIITVIGLQFTLDGVSMTRLAEEVLQVERPRNHND